MVFIPENADCRRAGNRRIAHERAVISIINRVDESISITNYALRITNCTCGRAADFIYIDSARNADSEVVTKTNTDRCQVGADWMRRRGIHDQARFAIRFPAAQKSRACPSIFRDVIINQVAAGVSEVDGVFIGAGDFELGVINKRVGIAFNFVVGDGNADRAAPAYVDIESTSIIGEQVIRLGDDAEIFISLDVGIFHERFSRVIDIIVADWTCRAEFGASARAAYRHA